MNILSITSAAFLFCLAVSRLIKGRNTYATVYFMCSLGIILTSIA